MILSEGQNKAFGCLDGSMVLAYVVEKDRGEVTLDVMFMKFDDNLFLFQAMLSLEDITMRFVLTNKHKILMNLNNFFPS